MKNPESKPRRWWNRCTKSLAWIAVGVLVPVCYLAWHIFGWPAPIRISYETTRLTAPLSPDGYVDYLRAYRESLPADVSDFRDDPWRALFENERDLTRPPNDLGWNRPHPRGTENIVYRDPAEALREHLNKAKSAIDADVQVREFQENGLEQRMRVPFSAADDPLLASVIEENKSWYNAVVDTYKATPVPDGPPNTLPFHGREKLAHPNMDTHFFCIELAERFRLRSMYRAGQSDLQGSFDDLAFTWNIAARCDHRNLLATALATSIELSSSQAIVKYALNPKELTPEFCIQIQKLPQESTYDAMVELMNRVERHAWLDAIQGLYADRCSTKCMGAVSKIKLSGRLTAIQSRRLWHATNWNQVLVAENEHFDSIVAAFQLPTWREQHSAFLKLLNDQFVSENQGDIDIVSALPWSVADPDKWLTQKLLPNVDWYAPAPQLAHLRDLRRRVVQIAARLAMWRQVHGEFPDELPSVLKVEGFSVASPTLLVDPFNELQLGYEKQSNGFVLYSIGPNMQKDGSGFEECSISETNVGDQNRPDDDHIWRWPPAE